MARATRSTVISEKDHQNGCDQRNGKLLNKKRKTSIPEDQPAPKQLRTENDLQVEDPGDTDDLEQSKPVVLDHTGDLPIDPLDAQKILEVLEMIDTQGLLDRVFPLPSKFSDPSTSKSQSGSYSFRTLLKDSSRHPLCVLRSAVQHRFPISYHPRSRPSSPAAQQLRFCNLALSLLDQASIRPDSFRLDMHTIMSDFSHDVITDDTEVEVPTSPAFPDKFSITPSSRRYSLMQHLPSGNWWSSLNSAYTLHGKDLKDIATAHSELVAVLPSASTTAYKFDSTLSSEILDAAPPSTLGSCTSNKLPAPKVKLPSPRKLSCGTFLNYGPNTSFAPTFNQEGVEVGRTTLGEIIWRWETGKDTWNKDKEVVTRNDTSVYSPTIHRQITCDEAFEVSTSVNEGVSLEDGKEVGGLEGLLSTEQVAGLRTVLDSLQLEDAVRELFERNSMALQRLEELQMIRLSKGGDAAFDDLEGSEEWNTAQGILCSLTLLTSLRPRSSNNDAAPLAPSESALRKLHRALPTAAVPGWYGTLPPSRPTALRDDSTLYIKSSAATSTAVALASVPTAATPAPNAAASTPYPGYPYTSFTAPYRAGAGYQYKPSQPPYYPNTHAQPQGQNQAAAGSSNYYPNQQYNPTAGQQSYSSWYYQQPQTAAAAIVTGIHSGTATPQPGAVGISTTMATSYAGFFTSTTQSPAAHPHHRAVANTVNVGKHAQLGPPVAWTSGTNTPGYAMPTLPPHLRGISQQGMTGTYGGYQHTYYGYQPTSATR